MSQSTKKAWGTGKTEYFHQLNPSLILKYIDQLGYSTTGRCLALNSLENRVYEIEVENPDAKTVSENFVIAKFYRPGRWSREQIQEEHQFLKDLITIEIPAIAPLEIDGVTLFQTSDEDGGLYYCLFPKRGGRNPDELRKEDISRLGRLMGRMHAVGKNRKFEHRISLTPQVYGQDNLESLLNESAIPEHYRANYETLARQFIETITPSFEKINYQRVHGDCHWGNLLHTEAEGFFFIDFDDVVSGPVVQDFWLMIPGRDDYSKAQREEFIESYTMWADFSHRELALIEPLRGLRYLHFDHWIAKRWEDPSFPAAFPHFKEDRYWAERINDIREQISLCQNPYAYDPYEY